MTNPYAPREKRSMKGLLLAIAAAVATAIGGYFLGDKSDETPAERRQEAADTVSMRGTGAPSAQTDLSQAARDSVMRDVLDSLRTIRRPERPGVIVVPDVRGLRTTGGSRGAGIAGLPALTAAYRGTGEPESGGGRFHDRR